jgi:hypothetical protein
LIFCFGIYCNTDSFRSKYYNAQKEDKKNEIVLEWIEFALNNNHSVDDSLIRAQKPRLAQFTVDQKFEICFYAVLYANLTKTETLIPISQSKFKPNSLDYYLLSALERSLNGSLLKN